MHDGVLVDQISDVTDVGELCKLGVLLGMTTYTSRHQDEGGPRFEQVHFELPRDGWKFGATALVDLALIVGYASGQPGERIVEDLRQGMAARHFPMDRPIQDVLSIGEGPAHQGHEDE